MCCLETGYRTRAAASVIRNGDVRDKLKPSHYGIGFIGEGKYKLSDKGVFTPAGVCWKSIIERCYSPRRINKYPTYSECTLHPDWHNFQNFAEWYYTNHIEGYHLDKDLLVYGNTVYGAETCVFVTRHLNNLFIKESKGAAYLTKVGHYSSCVNVNGESVYLGTFNTKSGAMSAYRKAKSEEIIRQAYLPTTPHKLIKPLLSRAHSLSQFAS